MVRAKLRELPKTLDQTYDRILQEVPGIHKTFVQSALRWLAFSERPLLLSELEEAAVIDPSFGPFNAEDSRFLDSAKISELCGPLIVLGEKRLNQNLRGTDDWLFLMLRNIASIDFGWNKVRIGGCTGVYTTVSLSHYSVKEYLTSKRLEMGSLSEYFLMENISHRYLTECAIIYLQGLGQGNILSRRVFDEYPLLEYCAVNWMQHFRKADTDPNLIDLLMNFFDLSEPAAYINWLNSYDPDGDLFGKRFDNLIDLITRLIEDGAEVEGSCGGILGTPLGVASYYRFEGLVEKLLEAGADPNGRGGYFGSVLQSAAAGGSKKIAEILVTSGANIWKVGGRWKTALGAAARYGHDDVVSLLLNGQLDIATISALSGSALYEAVLEGEVKIVNKLLDAGADINMWGLTSTPLYTAVSKGFVELVQILLNRGADADKGDQGVSNYPLAAAVSGGDVNIVRMLLKASAPSALKHRSIPLLRKAILSESLDVFKMILDAGGGLYIDREGNSNLDPGSLYEALEREQFEMARILLERNVEISEQAFLEAIRQWNTDPWFVRTILKGNPNINAHSGDSGSILHLSIDTGDKELVRLILDRGPYVDALSDEGNVLTRAIMRGMMDIATELIEKGADIHRELRNKYCPFASCMELAIRQTSPDFEMADILLGLGVDVNCGGRRSLGLAIEEGSVDVIQYLGKKGVDLNSVMDYDTESARYRCTPLQLAVQKGRIDIIDTLLELGADTNGPAGKQGTALNYAMFSEGDTEAIFRRLISQRAVLNDTPQGCGIICAAYWNGHHGLVPELINLGADVNAVFRTEDFGDWVPLSMAIWKKDTKIVHLLREHGAQLAGTNAQAAILLVRNGRIQGLNEVLLGGVDPNSSPPWNSPINAAIKKGYKDMVELLLSYGASPNCLPGADYDPLTSAIKTGDPLMTEYLIQMGADPNKRGEESWSLAEAVSQRSFELVDLLLESGADIMNFNGLAFRSAIKGGEKMLYHLLERVPLEDRQKALDTALQQALHLADVNLCELLLKLGADANSIGERGSPFHYLFPQKSDDSGFLCDLRDREIIFNLLIENGAKPRDVKGCPSVLANALTVLYEAEANKSNPAQKLLEMGADPNGKGGSEHDTPLQTVISRQCSRSFIELLIIAGANVNTISGDFGTALHTAAYKGDYQTVTILLQHGANVDVLSPRYGGVIQAAARAWGGSKSVRIMELLHSHGASIHSIGGEHGNALQAAAKRDNLEAVIWLLEHGADPNLKGPGGTPVQVAIESWSWRVASYLEQRYGRARATTPEPTRYST
ncbi:hypothetical protein TWF730_003856 [Orbilia blumenaviensis]|uniref:Ankyrin n=1 Tax=Orbilia blumenaviensis TaxID=1796055 RepID=A0AAV9U161_9PEZI